MWMRHNDCQRDAKTAKKQITKKQSSPITQHQNGNYLERVSANIVLYLILFSVLHQKPAWCSSATLLHGTLNRALCTTVPWGPKSWSQVWKGTWRASCHCVVNLMPSRGWGGNLVYLIIKVCLSGSKISKSDKLSGAMWTNCTCCIFDWENGGTTRCIVGKPETLHILISGMDQTDILTIRI